MWASNLGFVAVLLAALALTRRNLFVFAPRPDRRRELCASIGVGGVGVAGFALAHAGMHAAWSRSPAITDLAWLRHGLMFAAVVVGTHLLLRLFKSLIDEWVLPVTALLVLLGLLGVFVWETRDANAYISTRALPELRDYAETVRADPDITDETREQTLDDLGQVPDELEYQRQGHGRAVVLEPRWLAGYNAAAGGYETATARYPGPAGASVAPVRLGDDVERQLAAFAVAAGLLVLAVYVLERRSISGVLTSRWLLYSGALCLLTFDALALAGPGRLPPSVPFAGQTLTIFELMKLVMVVLLAAALGRLWSGGSRDRLARACLAVVGVSIAVLIARDTGAGTALLVVAALMVSLAATPRRLASMLLVPMVLVAGAPLLVHVVEDRVPSTVAVRLNTWLDPWGTHHAASLDNMAARASDRIEAAGAELAADRSTARHDGETGPAIMFVEQELRWRLAALEGRPGDARPVVPLTAAEEEVLLAADQLWADLGGFSVPQGESDELAVFRGRLEGVLASLRDGSQGRSSTNDNFQLQRSLYALREGGLVGVGLGQGKPEMIPDITEDVALGQLGEALGLAGLLATTALLVFLVARGMERARRLEIGAVPLLIVGLSAQLGLQALISLGGILGALPFTGLTFPLISRSGTALVTNVFAIGLVALLAQTGRPGRVVSPRLRGPRHAAGITVAFGLVASSAVPLQLVGRMITPGPVLAELPSGNAELLGASDQWALPDYRIARGPMVDRNGAVLARSSGLSGQRSYPDPALATSLSHTLRELDLSLGDQLVDVEHVREGLGPTAVLTIDGAMQEAVRVAVEEETATVEQLRPDDVRSAVVVLDVTTGAIVAAESRPGFSLTEPVDPAAWARAEGIERRNGFSYRYLNRVIDGIYPPGSVHKTITAAAALELGHHEVDSLDFDYRGGPTGPLEPDGVVHLDAWHQLPLEDGPPITDGNHPHVDDWLFDLEHAFAYSCNVAFAQMGAEIGAEGLVDISRRFGFEREVTVFGLGASTSQLDNDVDAPSDERFLNTSSSTLARTSFGQGQVLTSPLHVALVASAIANDGTIMQPYVVAGTRQGREWIMRHEPTAMLETGLSESTLDGMRTLMGATVTYGLGGKAKVNSTNEAPGVAGKTGSAEWSDATDATHAWFMGYFPIEQPRLAVAVVVERGGAGGDVAARIASRIFGSDAAVAYVGSSSQ